MAVDVVVPEVGEVGMEVTFVAWYRAEGDLVTSGEPLYQVDTQKTLFDVEAVADGRLVGLAAREGDLIEPHQVIARILAEGEELATTATPPTASAPDAGSAAGTDPVGADRPTTAPPTDDAGRPRRRDGVSPRARRVAGRLGVDLDDLVGTGPDGLITEADVQAAAERRLSVAPDARPGAAPNPTSVASTDRDRVRRAVADLTSRSWQSVPHFYVRLDADLTVGLELAKPMPLLVGAFARALRDRPEANLAWAADGRTKPRSSVDLGILVDTPDGLLLPVVRDADRLGLAGLADAIRAAADRARSGRLAADDFGPRSGSVSNLGMFAVDQFAGIVAVPDPLLLAIGRATTRPVWDGGGWQPRTIASLTLSVDHRALDGADAGRLMSDLEAILADPASLA